MTTLWVSIATLPMVLAGPAAAVALLASFAVAVALIRAFSVLRKRGPAICGWIWSSLRFGAMLVVAPVWAAFGELHVIFKKWMRGNSVIWRSAGMSLLSASVAAVAVWGLTVSSLLFVLSVAYEALLHSPY
jgi:hypothetical protein